MDIFEEKQNDIVSMDSVNTDIDYSNINKTALGKVSGVVVDRVLSGTDDALEVYIKAKALSEVVSNIIKDVKGLALDEAGNYESSDSKKMGCEFMIKTGATSYSFDHDEEWNSISDEIKKLKEKQKAREKQMIDAIGYAELVDKDTGEVVPKANVKKASGSILSITIPKT